MAEDYTYIVAWLRSLEARLPDRAWFEHFARTPVGGLLGALKEYYPAFEMTSSIAEFEQGFEAEKEAILEKITALLSDERPKLFLRAGYDFANVVVAWKAGRLQRRATLVPFGLVPPEEIERAVGLADRGALPEHLGALIETLERTESETKSLAACDYAGEAASWRFLAAVAPGDEAREYLRRKIDLANIKTFIRLKRSALRKESIELAWIEGGDIEPATLRGLLRGTEEEFLGYLSLTFYSELRARGLGTETPLWRIDPMLKRLLMDAMGGSRYRAFDFSPVLYHLELRDRDTEMMRAVIVGKLNELPEELILERVEALLPS
jgi:V/A-type H+-transporting ATPase subunit C